MHRFYIAPEDWNPDSLVLGGAEAHHARDVLRLQAGGRVVVFNGRGHEVTAEIAKVTRGEVVCTQNARGARAAADLSDHAGAGHPEREKHGSNRAESSRDRSGGDSATDFRAHHCSFRGEGSGAKTSEMATGRDRSGQTMWTKLAADGATPENAA